jgi:hypothetical protein
MWNGNDPFSKIVAGSLEQQNAEDAILAGSNLFILDVYLFNVFWNEHSFLKWGRMRDVGERQAAC